MAGIYIHIPFCKKKCTYCDFHFSTNYHAYEEEMIFALAKEITLRQKELKGEQIETIYFGGGTPSILSNSQLNLLMSTIYQRHSVSPSAEITLECNPDDISEEKLKFWKENKINRLSIGIQSFDQEDLTWMNRAHSAQESENAIQLVLNNGFDNISIDLIYGLPNMDLQRWEKQIDKVLAYEIPHISAYCLTVEKKTALDKMVRTNEITPANNELQAQHFELLQKKLKAANFEQYEISNFAKVQKYSKHNSSYWKNQLYQGIGPSAHSFSRTIRSWNISNNKSYLKSISENILPSTEETLSPEDQFNELVLTGLRTMWGVNLFDLNAIFKLDKSFYELIANFQKTKDIVQSETHIKLTEKGLLIADNIAMQLFK